MTFGCNYKSKNVLSFKENIKYSNEEIDLFEWNKADVIEASKFETSNFESLSHLQNKVAICTYSSN